MLLKLLMLLLVLSQRDGTIEIFNGSNLVERIHVVMFINFFLRLNYSNNCNVGSDRLT